MPPRPQKKLQTTGGKASTKTAEPAGPLLRRAGRRPSPTNITSPYGEQRASSKERADSKEHSGSKEHASSKERAGSKERAATCNRTPEQRRGPDHGKSPSPERDKMPLLPPVRGSAVGFDFESPSKGSIRGSAERMGTQSSLCTSTTRHSSSFNTKREGAFKDRMMSRIGGSEGRLHEAVQDPLRLSAEDADQAAAGGLEIGRRMSLEEPPECPESEGCSTRNCVKDWHRSRIRKANGIRVFADCLTLKLSPEGPDKGVAGCQWTVPLAQSCYFEVVVLVLEGSGGVWVGCASKGCVLKARLGMQGGLHKAFSYASRDGSVLVGVPSEDCKTNNFSVGDVVGCGYSEAKNEVYFTKNGRVVKSVTHVAKTVGDLMPTVSLEGDGTVVRLNCNGCFEYTLPSAPSPKRDRSPSQSAHGVGTGGWAARAGAQEAVGLKSLAGRVRMKRAKEEELGPYLRTSGKAKRHIKLLKDKVTFCRAVNLNDVLAEHSLVFGATPVPSLLDILGWGSGAESGAQGGVSSVFYFEVVVGASAPVDEMYQEVGAFHGADVYVGLAETSLSGLPGIEDYRSIAVYGRTGKLYCNEEELSRTAPDDSLNTVLRNADKDLYDAQREPMCFSAGDVVGCGVDLRLRRVFFTLNGTFAGWAGEVSGDIEGDSSPLGQAGTGPAGEWVLPHDDNIKMYPVVAFKHKEDVLSINIGSVDFPQRPMAFDVQLLPPLPSPSSLPYAHSPFSNASDDSPQRHVAVVAVDDGAVSQESGEQGLEGREGVDQSIGVGGVGEETMRLEETRLRKMLLTSVSERSERSEGDKTGANTESSKMRNEGENRVATSDLEFRSDTVETPSSPENTLSERGHVGVTAVWGGDSVFDKTGLGEHIAAGERTGAEGEDASGGTLQHGSDETETETGMGMGVWTEGHGEGRAQQRQIASADRPSTVGADDLSGGRQRGPEEGRGTDPAWESKTSGGGRRDEDGGVGAVYNENATLHSLHSGHAGELEGVEKAVSGGRPGSAPLRGGGWGAVWRGEGMQTAQTQDCSRPSLSSSKSSKSSMSSGSSNSNPNPNISLRCGYTTAAAAEAAAALLAQKVGEKWQMKKLLGRGAFGSVFEAINTDTAECFAVKEVLLYGSDSQNSQRLAMLEREIAIMGQLQHPNIVQYYGTARTEDALQIFMELAPRGSLQATINEHGVLPENLARKYTQQILQGLNYLHTRDQPVIHRDIKAANVLLWDTGVAKLADFGASKRLNQLVTQTFENKTMIGTPFWMAPEVIRSTGHGRKADVWSVGCTLIEMLRGKPPWYDLGNPITAMFIIASTEDYPTMPEKVSAACENFTKLCLARDPEARPAAMELLQHPWVLE